MEKIIEIKKKKNNSWMIFLLIIPVIGLIVANVLLTIFVLPDYMGKINDILLAGANDLNGILRNGLIMLAVTIVSTICNVLSAFCMAIISSFLSKILREKTFKKVLKFGLTEINNFSVASLITRSTNDITQVQMFVSFGLTILIQAPLSAVLAILKISQTNLQWTVATAVAVSFMAVIVTILIIFALPKFKKLQTLTDNLNAAGRENLTGLKVVTAFNAKDYEEGKFKKANKDLASTHLFVGRFMAIIAPMMGAVMGGLTLAIYWIGAHLINAQPLGTPTGVETSAEEIFKALLAPKAEIASTMLRCNMYTMQVVMAFIMLVMILIMLPRAIISLNRVMQILNTKERITDGKENLNVAGNLTLEFKNVSFNYSNAAESVLSNISFSAQQGETVAFIGSTGSGKSTLINLVPRFYDVTSGEILINNQNIKDITTKELRDQIGYISQTAVIFSGSVKENITYGRILTDENIEKATKIAQASEFVNKLEGTYDYILAERGKNLSGGQKQRISIARALAKNPKILIFDDSFSALDFKTASKLSKAINSMPEKPLTLIVAQRISSIKDATKIVVLDEGKIAGIGTHEELLKTCGVYSQIAASQLTEDEIATTLKQESLKGGKK